jgi:hypothetical protein
MSPKMEPLTRRMNALYQLLRLERPTTKAKAYSEWEVKPEIIFGDDLAKEIYTNIEEKELKNANVSINEYISDSDK